ncbi:hypothetical protein AKJ09_02393 [Labilithrix luteola]|uniref:Uncharacterized protein n=1 Tax=Labilithrix luteola TaxID=1391654 RepID=A0A0K1PRJ8_9BACT|nr:hypothetical protein AKJ09_02393 [Labilithrix luteola]
MPATLAAPVQRAARPRPDLEFERFILPPRRSTVRGKRRSEIKMSNDDR